MSFLNLNLSDVSSSSLNNLSDMSFTPSSVNNNLTQNGGFSLFGWTDKNNSSSTNTNDTKTALTQLLLEQFKEKNYDLTYPILKKSIEINDKKLIDTNSFKYKDADGNTILHYLVMDTNNKKNLIEELLKKNNSKDFINIQNNNGDTALHLAVKLTDYELASLLEKYGADRNIKNNQDLKIDSETDIDVEDNNNLQKTNNNNKETQDKAKEITDDITNLLFKNKTDNQDFNELTSDVVPINLTETQNADFAADTEKFLENLKTQLNNTTNNNLSGGSCSLMKHYGGCGCGSGLSDQFGGCGTQSDTENLLYTLKNYIGQSGGKKNKNQVEGKRSLRKSDNADDEDRGRDLMRLLQEKTTTIIENTINSITKIIEDNKKDFKGVKNDRLTARAYKAALWKMVKDKNPALKSPFDIAIEMEKLLSKDVLKTINVKEYIDILKQRDAEKESKEKSTDKRKQSKKKSNNSDSFSETSSENVIPQPLSETSITSDN